MKLNRLFVILSLTFLIFVAFWFGFWYGQVSTASTYYGSEQISLRGFISSLGDIFRPNKFICPICPPEDIDFSLFWETYNELQKSFVNKDKIDTQKMIYGAIEGMVGSLGDPYTVFLPPQETKKFIEDAKGSFEGVGMEISVKEGQLQVITPLEGTPAQRAGLRAGDKITQIDGKTTIDMTIDEAVSLIRGQKGTKVILTIFREGWEKTQEIEVSRAVIEIPSLKWEMLAEDKSSSRPSSPERDPEKDGNIAYLKLYHFTEKAGSDFQTAAFEILNSPADRIILDLRNNPGGYLDVVQEISGWFLEKGQTVVIEDYGKDEELEIYKSKGPARLSDYPTVVLINQGSASASEILAGALRDNRGIILIGEKTFGKGSIQGLTRLREGSSLKVTIANWLTPKGELISDIGLEPKIKVEMTEEDYEQERDPQLDKAIEIIKEI